MQYSPPLDGIRALAIGGVFIFHLYPGYLRGGFTGVDVFFVLSGFLITSIILHDLQRQSFSLREFYLRRIQRLLPNIIVTVLTVLALSSLLLLPSAARQVGRHSIWTLANLSNIYIWKNFGGYWGEVAEAAPLLHTWSLAIEEQFYLLFPTCLVLVSRFQNRFVTTWLGAATLLSFALCVFQTTRDSAASFYLLPTRLWELSLGAVLASLRLSQGPSLIASWAGRRIFAEMCGWIGFSLVCGGFFVIDESQGFPGTIAAVPTFGTALILVSIWSDTLISRLLSWPVFVFVGKLSYSLYLWHWPLITIGKTVARMDGRDPVVGAVLGALLSIGCAWTAYSIVEQRLRSRGPGRAWRLAACAAGFILVTLTSAWVGTTRKLDTTRYFDTPEFRGLLYSAGRVSDSSRAVRYQDVRFPALGRQDEMAWRTGGIIHGNRPTDPQVVVLGSSHALMYSPVIDEICKEHGDTVAFLGLQGAPVFFTGSVNLSLPSPEEAQGFDVARRAFLRKWRPRVLFVIDRWDLRLQSEASFRQALRRFLTEVSPSADKVVWVAQVPVTGTGGDTVNLRELMTWRRGDQPAFPRVMPDEMEEARTRSVAAAYDLQAEFPNLHVLRPDLRFVDKDHSVRWMSGRTSYYADDDHLANAGAELVRDLFRNAIVDPNVRSSRR